MHPYMTASLPLPRGRRKRASSYDRTGGNADCTWIEPGETQIILEQLGTAGYITRIWCTPNIKDETAVDYLQHICFRFTFDHRCTAEQVPLGMLAGVGPWRINDIQTPLVNVMRSRPVNQEQTDPGSGSFNLHWIMPFTNMARIEVTNPLSCKMTLHFNIEYVTTTILDPCYYFHCHFHEMKRTQAVTPERIHDESLNGVILEDDEVKNRTDAYNYLFAHIKNQKGLYAGTVLAVESHPDNPGKWYEGDEMFFIDDEPFPPTIHGTGTEDYFGMAWGVHRPYQAFDHGVTHYERDLTDHDRFYDGRFTLYRWHIWDPIYFDRSLRGSIEAGHANDCAQYYSSTAFWYGKPLVGET
jgi:hypothetical protein